MLNPSIVDLCFTLLIFVFVQVKFGAVDCTVHQSTCGQYNVRGYPTIKVFGSNKESPSDYQGGRDSGSIVAEANKAWASNAKPREVGSFSDVMSLQLVDARS